MLEILLLIFGVKHIGKLADKRGFSESNYKIYTALVLISFEIIGLLIGKAAFSTVNYDPYHILKVYSIGLICLCFGFATMYLIVTRRFVILVVLWLLPVLSLILVNYLDHRSVEKYEQNHETIDSTVFVVDTVTVTY